MDWPIDEVAERESKEREERDVFAVFITPIKGKK